MDWKRERDICIKFPSENNICSGYVKDALSRNINGLNVPVEILQKPVSNQILIDIVEEKRIYEFGKFGIDVSAFKNAGFRHELLKILNVLGERQTDEDEDGKFE